MKEYIYREMEPKSLGCFQSWLNNYMYEGGRGEGGEGVREKGGCLHDPMTGQRKLSSCWTEVCARDRREYTKVMKAARAN